jgi:dipeptidyl aminopeptidase/acylaminoacyl peptidase
MPGQSVVRDRYGFTYAAGGPDNNAFDLSCPRAGECWIAGDPVELLWTTDGGSHWSSQAIGDEQGLIQVSSPRVDELTILALAARMLPMVSTCGALEGNPFSSPAAYMAIPRVGDLILSPAGDRLVASISQLDDMGAKFVTSLWALDPKGRSAARRLTRSVEGETLAAFLPDGSLLFASSRPRPTGEGASENKEEAERAALWVLPVGGEAFVVGKRPGGITAIATGRQTTTVIVGSRTAPGSVTADEDREWWAARRKRKVSAALFESLPVRHWDRYLGPDEVHLLAATMGPFDDNAPSVFRDLTPDAGQALFECHPVLSPDGSTVLVDWTVPIGAGHVRRDVVAIDVATGSRRTIASTGDGSFDYERPAISPDGKLAAVVRTSRAKLTAPSATDLWLIDLADGSGRALDPGDEPYPREITFNADGSALFITADWHGRGPLFHVAIETGVVSRIAPDGAFTSPLCAPDGSAVYALRSSIDEPPRPVRLDLLVGAQAKRNDLTVIDAPGVVGPPPGRLEELTTTGADGTALHAWLVLPSEASADHPVPCALWVHGGPAGSWNGWHWRWNPWLLAARGWAVLLPDPALSTGYGMKMIRRGWGQWGGVPFDDLMAVTDAALKRPDLDPARTAAMGGSYGGYMANWIAGHTDRFAAIVSHASVWSLEQFQATTDGPAYWVDEWGYPDTNPEMYEKWSPERFAQAIRTPMLIIHGERDYRCPVSESLRLWADLVRRAANARFLWFANENHWVLQPGDGIVWYETVFAFLDEHVLGRPWERPALL